MGKKLKWFIAVAFLLLINPWLLLELGEAASPVKNEIVFGFSAPITGHLIRWRTLEERIYRLG